MKTNLARRIDIAQAEADNAREILRREWLITNGLGGYASGTICGMVSRRYHGLLIAALPAPFGRVVMLNHLAENLRFEGGRSLLIGGEEPSRVGEADAQEHYVREFRVEDGLPIWVYEAGGFIIEKRLLLIHGQNTVHVSYRLLSDQDGARVELRPSVHFRPHERDVGEPLNEGYSLLIHERRYEISSTALPHPLHLYVHDEKACFTHEGGSVREIAYQTEADRGYRSRGVLWSPGAFTIELRANRAVTFVASTEAWPSILALDPEEVLAADLERRRRLIAAAAPSVRSAPAAELVLAADQFIITPAGRVEDAARAKAAGEEVRTVIAGYHWFTDWGRDTMISLEGLTLTTGRHHEASWILRTFAHYVRDGLIPNLFPEGESEGLYHTADATLWFFHALDRYLDVTQDRGTLQLLLPKLVEIAEQHLRGTRFGIGVDPADGLLRQGAEGYQLTWMDAKVEGWVVTPRRGKAVEINALWYNALRLLADWLNEEQGADAARPFAEHAQRARESFNRRFWSEERGYLLDIVDGEQGDDPALRPNQIFALSLRHPVLDEAHWSAVLDKVRAELLTPVGLRTLAPGHPDYKSRYFGDLRARDAAYHQGTVWAWLIGPFIDAWLKVHPDDCAGARHLLDGLIDHLDHACVGSLSEVFDAEEPYTPRACIAQAWSVAEVLRCLAKTAASSV
ncbi:MAG TPA: amylo-alpha-1,6-glucosidase [Chthoniobacteraceae bacterium]|jgi:predicted glycogen debranching enzyme|nr:amylo-alpha-1,6-glucosidase [Chthoniobacteraceae bacterium]